MTRNVTVYDDADYEPRSRYEDQYFARRAEDREQRARDDADGEAMDLDARQCAARRAARGQR